MGPRKIRRDIGPPEVGIDFPDGSYDAKRGGVVEEDVDSPEGVERARDKRVDLVAFCHIAGNRQDAAAVFLDDGGGLGEIRLAARTDDDVGAVSGKLDCKRAAYASSAEPVTIAVLPLSSIPVSLSKHCPARKSRSKLPRRCDAAREAPELPEDCACRHLAYSTMRVSRISVTFISPG